MASRKSRRAALVAAACLIGPTVPGGIVDRRPDEAAKALTRMADLLVPWLEGGSSPSTQHHTAPEAAATAVSAHPGTGEASGSTRTGTEEE